MSVLHAMKVALVVLAIAALTASAPLLAQKTELKPPAPAAAAPPAKKAEGAETVEAKPGHLRGVARRHGQVQWSKVAEGICAVDGQSTIVSLLPAGAAVKKNEIVCELDSSLLEDRLREQEIATLGADADHRSATLARARAEAALSHYVEHTYKEQQALLQSEVDTAQEELHDADGRVERTHRARTRLDKLLDQRDGLQTAADILASLDLDDRVAAAAVAHRRAQRALRIAQARKTTLEQSTRDRMIKELLTHIEEARASEQARAKRAEMERTREKALRLDIEHCTLRAPFDGVVNPETTASQLDPKGNPRAVAAGMTVHAGQKIFTIGGGPLVVKVGLRPALAKRITIGDRVRFNLGASPDTGFMISGVLEAIETAGVQQGFGQNRDVRRTMAVVTVKIEHGARHVTPPVWIPAEIPIREVGDLPSVPLFAVLHNGGKDRVAVKKTDGQIDWREVSLGLDDGEIVEIAQGIANGETVVSNPRDLLSWDEQEERFGPIEYPGDEAFGGGMGGGLR